MTINKHSLEEDGVVKDIFINGLIRAKHSFPAMYALKHENTGKVYVGSTANLYSRIKCHKHQLKLDTYFNENVSDLYNEDPCFNLVFVKVETREQALDVEQKVLDHFNRIKTNILLNKAVDARLNNKGIKATEEKKEKMREAAQKRWENKAEREKTGARIKQMWANESYRNTYLQLIPKGKPNIPVKINGTEFQSISHASRLLNISRHKVRAIAEKLD